MIGADIYYAPAPVRDRFLEALDQNDAALCSRLAANLTGCMNPLPGLTCNLLGLPIGSTYGSAARRVLLLTVRIADSGTTKAAHR